MRRRKRRNRFADDAHFHSDDDDGDCFNQAAYQPTNQPNKQFQRKHPVKEKKLIFLNKKNSRSQNFCTKCLRVDNWLVG